MHPYQACEERDASGTVTNRFFSRGQQNSATAYFYSIDHLGSVRELTDSSGGIQAEYGYDSFGQISKTLENVASVMQYASYLCHLRTGFYLTVFRFYNSKLGRWLSRDPRRALAKPNSYDYVGNSTVSFVDPLGLAKQACDPCLNAPEKDPDSCGKYDLSDPADYYLGLSP
jgi:RHS repeat-associated protein